MIGSTFRAIQSPDSDDDPTPRNSPPITNRTYVRTARLNGNNPHKPNVTYSSGGVDDESGHDNRYYNRNSRRRRNNSLNANFQFHHSNFSSHSSSRISSSGSSSEGDAASTEGSTPLFLTVIHNREVTSNDNNNGYEHPTPKYNRRTSITGNNGAVETTPIANRSRIPTADYTPDSGMSSMADSATGSTHRKNDYGNDSSMKKGGNDTETTKLFIAKVNRIRRNYRNIGGNVSYSEEDSE